MERLETTTLVDEPTATSRPLPDLVATSTPHEAAPTECRLLVRYGVVPEVVRVPGPRLERGAEVLLKTPHGVQSGTVLSALRPKPVTTGYATSSITADRSDAAAEPDDASSGFELLRVVSDDDRLRLDVRRQRGRTDYAVWQQRIAHWGLQIELIDVEYTLDGDDGAPILYVLPMRGPDATRLALQAAADGYGLIAVQPVAASGPVPIAREAGGCGSGGCGCHTN